MIFEVRPFLAVLEMPCLVSFCSRCDSDNQNNCLDCETGYELNSLESACVLDDNGNGGGGGDGGSEKQGSDGSFNTLEIIGEFISECLSLIILQLMPHGQLFVSACTIPPFTVLVICSIIGVVVLLAIIAGIVMTLCRRKNTPRPRHTTTEEPVTYHKQ